MLVGFLVYFTVPFVLASGASMEQLQNNPMVWTEIAPAPLL